jgi:hypothetical protein
MTDEYVDAIDVAGNIIRNKNRCNIHDRFAG